MGLGFRRTTSPNRDDNRDPNIQGTVGAKGLSPGACFWDVARHAEEEAFLGLRSFLADLTQRTACGFGV